MRSVWLWADCAWYVTVTQPTFANFADLQVDPIAPNAPPINPTLHNTFLFVPSFQNNCGAKSGVILYVFFHSPNICPSCCIYSSCWSRDSDASRVGRALCGASEKVIAVHVYTQWIHVVTQSVVAFTIASSISEDAGRSNGDMERWTEDGGHGGDRGN